jgi:hypothetical protein
MNMTPGREPIWYGAIARMAVAAASGYGFDLTTEQVLMVLGVVEMLVAVFTRRRVTPVA